MKTAGKATRVRLVTGLSLAVLAGLAWMGSHSSPLQYLIVNAAALIAAGLIAWIPLPRFGPKTAIVICAAGITLLAATLTPDALPALSRGHWPSGVHRWHQIGPFRLHAAVLFLPALAALASGLRGWTRASVLAAVAVIPALQPDRAAALAWLLAVLAIVRQPRSWADTLALTSAAAALAATWARPDALAPVAFVETVLQDGWHAGPAWGAALSLGLAAALAAPLTAGRAGQACAASMAGFAMASLLGAYPAPFIGYGASPILGCGLAASSARAPLQYNSLMKARPLPFVIASRRRSNPGRFAPTLDCRVGFASSQ
ncbi:hypothetical protein [Novosphingobium beihaiensis]|uniref:Uncharacterized protein n=1 Tax=Novosphingobium beihaiensis TaxID=2930389 RepID=A0ABT0BUB4_9SPHN|nr:hypothetical protein [Novosphingobium beihaiensis]MCJ2188653.1 hypothetical protein [Novosphingobium beihaiensis]